MSDFGTMEESTVLSGRSNVTASSTTRGGGRGGTGQRSRGRGQQQYPVPPRPAVLPHEVPHPHLLGESGRTHNSSSVNQVDLFQRNDDEDDDGGYPTSSRPPPQDGYLPANPGRQQKVQSMDPNPYQIGDDMDAMNIKTLRAPDHESKQARMFLEGREETSIAVVEVRNLPLNIGCSRAMIEFGEPSGRTVVIRRDLPSVAVLQDEHSPSASPIFSGCSVVAYLPPKIVAVVTIESLDSRTKSRAVLGHVVSTLWSKKGVFELRLRAFDLSASESETAFAPNLPLTSIVLRVNLSAEKALGKPPLRMFDLSPAELQLIEDRKVRAAATLSDHQLTAQFCYSVFDPNKGGVPTDGAQRPAYCDITYLSPYNEQRGVALAIHGIHFAVPLDQSPRQLFKVVCEVDGRLQYTQFHDWTADAFRPKFLDAYYVFGDLSLRPSSFVLFRVYRLKFNPTVSSANAPPSSMPLYGGTWALSEYGWGATSLSSPHHHSVLRFGPTLGIPLYEGRPPQDFAAVVKTKGSADSAMAHLMDTGDVRMMKAAVGSNRPTLSVSICDPARLDECSVERILQAPPVKNSLFDVFKALNLAPSQVQPDANDCFVSTLFTSSS